jgi:hypothetical protein
MDLATAPATASGRGQASVRKASGWRSRIASASSAPLREIAEVERQIMSAPTVDRGGEDMDIVRIGKPQPRLGIGAHRDLRPGPARAQERDLAPRDASCPAPSLAAARAHSSRIRPDHSGAKGARRAASPAGSRAAPWDRARRRRAGPSSVEPEGQRLEIAALGQLRQLRMVGPGKARVQRICPRRPARPMPRARRCGTARDRPRASRSRARGSRPAPPAPPQAAPPLIGAQPRLQRLFRRREGGRVADHEAEARALGGQRLHRREGVAALGREAVRHARRLGPLGAAPAPGRSCRRPARSRPPPPARPARSRPHGEDVEHPPPRAEPRRRRRGSAAGRRRAPSSARPGGRPCRWRRSSAPGPAPDSVPRSTRVSSSSPSSDRARPPAFLTTVDTPGDVDQRRHQRVEMRLGPGGVGLDHRRVAEAVDDDARQAVGLGMDEPVEGRSKSRSRSASAGDQARRNQPRRSPPPGSVEHPRDDLRGGLTPTSPIGRRSASSSTASVPGASARVRRSVTSSLA